MIYHYLNLACLEERSIFESKDLDREVFFVDSISLRMISLALGYNKPRVPGSSNLENIKKNLDCSIFLTAEKVGFENEVILPHFSSCEYIKEFDLKSLVESKFEKLSPKICFLGISSPKQNIIAQELQKIWPDIDYYCIGAILNPAIIKNKKLVNFFSQHRIEFLLHLFWTPKRTLRKFILMLDFIKKLIISSQFRTDLRMILSKFSD